MKRVVFVSGTEFSGSTFFHMILANDAHGLAVGEAQNYMRPSQRRHFNLLCSCGEYPCRLWQSLKANGEEYFYAHLFDKYPEVEFIVDSSKNPLWIQDQKAYLHRQGIASKDILVWKTPYEFAQSYLKRGNMEAWERSWTVYHRLYYTLFEDWYAVPYGELASSREVLRAVCDFVDIVDFEGKERFWERPQHVVGGNWSARAHLYADRIDDPRQGIQHIIPLDKVYGKDAHRSIYYEKSVDPLVREHVDASMRENPQIEAIWSMLRSRDVRDRHNEETVQHAPIRMPSPFVRLRRLKYSLMRRYAAMRYGKRLTAA